MVDGSLSQEEIDLLLQGADTDSGGSESSTDAALAAGGGSFGQDLSPIERGSIGDMIYQALSGATEGVGMMISRAVKLGQPYDDAAPLSGLESEFGKKNIAFTQNLSGALNGTIAIFMPTTDAIKMSAITMGNEDSVDVNAEIDSAQISTVKELIGPVMFNMASQISARMGASVNPMPVDLKPCNGTDPFPLSAQGNYLKLQMPFSIEGSVDTRINVIIPMDMAQTIYQQSQASSRAQASGSADQNAADAQQLAGPQPGQTGIKDVGFPSLSAHSSGPLQPNMTLLMDVQMTMTVELGRTKMYIKDILGLGEGSIIELDKLAGEPVDLLVNGKLIAKGEVVVIDENFGVRVTDIVKPIERLSSGAQEEG